jgi:hypothetical protein
MVIHFTWVGLFPETDPLQKRWALVIPVEEPSWLETYLDNQSYWLGYSYALAFTFALVALRRYLENRACVEKRLTIGGFSLIGFLVVAGCFLVGCCGSPMLVVYLNVFGAAFVPLAKPLMAGFTTLTIILAWWWMSRRVPSLNSTAGNESLSKVSCDCNTPPIR